MIIVVLLLLLLFYFAIRAAKIGGNDEKTFTYMITPSKTKLSAFTLDLSCLKDELKKSSAKWKLINRVAEKDTVVDYICGTPITYILSKESVVSNVFSSHYLTYDVSIHSQPAVLKSIFEQNTLVDKMYDGGLFSMSPKHSFRVIDLRLPFDELKKECNFENRYMARSKSPYVNQDIIIVYDELRLKEILKMPLFISGKGILLEYDSKVNKAIQPVLFSSAKHKFKNSKIVLRAFIAVYCYRAGDSYKFAFFLFDKYIVLTKKVTYDYNNLDEWIVAYDIKNYIAFPDDFDIEKANVAKIKKNIAEFAVDFAKYMLPTFKLYSNCAAGYQVFSINLAPVGDYNVNYLQYWHRFDMGFMTNDMFAESKIKQFSQHYFEWTTNAIVLPQFGIRPNKKYDPYYCCEYSDGEIINENKFAISPIKVDMAALHKFIEMPKGENFTFSVNPRYRYAKFIKSNVADYDILVNDLKEKNWQLAENTLNVDFAYGVQVYMRIPRPGYTTSYEPSFEECRASIKSALSSETKKVLGSREIYKILNSGDQLMPKVIDLNDIADGNNYIFKANDSLAQSGIVLFSDVEKFRRDAKENKYEGIIMQYLNPAYFIGGLKFHFRTYAALYVLKDHNVIRPIFAGGANTTFHEIKFQVMDLIRITTAKQKYRDENGNIRPLSNIEAHLSSVNFTEKRYEFPGDFYQHFSKDEVDMMHKQVLDISVRAFAKIIKNDDKIGIDCYNDSFGGFSIFALDIISFEGYGPLILEVNEKPGYTLTGTRIGAEEFNNKFFTKYYGEMYNHIVAPHFSLAENIQNDRSGKAIYVDGKLADDEFARIEFSPKMPIKKWQPAYVWICKLGGESIGEVMVKCNNHDNYDYDVSYSGGDKFGDFIRWRALMYTKCINFV